MAASESLFIKACKGVEHEGTPIWLMRQAGRYMPEYRAIRRHYSLLEICKNPALAAEVTITAAEQLGVDAAIIFADLLLPLEVMGLHFSFAAGEGPVIEQPLRRGEQIAALETNRAGELGYVAEAVRQVSRHFAGRIPVIGFCGAPFTLASYMIEGGSSRHYLHTKKMMYNEPLAWKVLMSKLVEVLAAYATEQARAGAEALQVFDSWVGILSVADFEHYVLPHSTELVRRLQAAQVPVIYFGTETASLLGSIATTGAEVIGLDWRVPLDRGWKLLRGQGAVQGNLDPAVLFSSPREIRAQAAAILRLAAGRPGHIFNLGHGILPETPVENVKILVDFVHEFSTKDSATYSPNVETG